MSSDLPETGFDDSAKMARVLATYMDCPHAIRARLREDFHCPPTLSTIRRYRNEHLASLVKLPDEPFKAHEGHRPDEVRDKAASANTVFLAALKAERERSFEAKLIPAEEALRSVYLTRPDLVDKLWEKACR